MGIFDHRLDDVVQDVFVVVSKTAFEGRSSLRTWLYAITFRVVQEHHRAPARRARPDEAPSAEQVSPEEAVQHLPDARYLHELLAQLSEEQRLVLCLTELEGMAAPEIASELGVKLNTVYSRLRQGRKQLERIVARERARGRRSPAWGPAPMEVPR